MSDPNYVEMEVTIPTRIQFSTVRLRAGREAAAHMTDAGWTSSPEERKAAWDALADELAAMAAREAERVATHVQRDQRVAGNGKTPERY